MLNFCKDLKEILNYGPTWGNVSINLMKVIEITVIILIAYYTSIIVRALLRRKLLSKMGIIDKGHKTSVLKIIHYIIITIGVLLILKALGFDLTSIAVIAGALSIGVGFGLQNIINNFVSGIILLFENPIKVDDIVEIDGKWGKVKKINIRSTTIATFDKSTLIVPNSNLISNNLTNWTHDDLTARVTINVAVGYESNIELAKELLLKISSANPLISKVRKPEVYFVKFGEYSLNFLIWIWTDDISNNYTILNDIHFEIVKKFRESDIKLTAPLRDVRITK